MVSLPRECEASGYGPGASILVEQLEDGSLHLVRADEVRDLIRSSGKRRIATHREALAILADHDRGQLRLLTLQAAVLAHGIAESQVFIDGNKRRALIAFLTFLDINGWVVDADDLALASWILDLSQRLSARTPGSATTWRSGRSR